MIALYILALVLVQAAGWHLGVKLARRYCDRPIPRERRS